jgi:structure-specific recognition protein 1
MSNDKENNSKSKKNDIFVKGLNWGNLKTTENELIFSHKSKLWFEMPLNTISNIQHITNKNEIALEINQDDMDEDITLCEMRLFVPEQENKNKKNKNSDENESIPEENKSIEKNEENEEISLNENEDNPKIKINKSRAETIKDDIIKKAKIGSVSNSIAHIQDIQMVTPRGKFDLYFTKNYFKIHGQSFNYQILNKNILKVFLLPKIDNHNHFFVLQLKSPLIQGNTQYPFLIFQILSDEETTMNLNISEKDSDLAKNFEKMENNQLEGKLMDIIAQLFNGLIHVGVIIPSKNFSFNTGPYIKCSYKVNEGVLYPLEKCLLFVHKPVLYILHRDINQINFARLQESAGQQRTFDMIVKTIKDTFKFVGLDKNEMELLKTYFEGKKIKLNMVDENYNNIDMSNYKATRRRAHVDEEVPELPSDEELISNEDYSDDSSSEEYENDDEEDSKKQKSKPKGKEKKETKKKETKNNKNKKGKKK